MGQSSLASIPPEYHPSFLAFLAQSLAADPEANGAKVADRCRRAFLACPPALAAGDACARWGG
jgi:hypothetical protein